MPYRLMTIATLLIAVGGAGLATAHPAGAAGSTRYVATDGDDTDNDCLQSSNPCATIQYAVDQADSGDTVSIGAGVFAESVRIRQSLNLIGAGAVGSAKSTIKGGSSGDPGVWVDGVDTDTQPQVIISDLDISGNTDNSGVLATSAAVTVKDSVVSGNNNDGIQAQGGSSLAVSGSAATGNLDSGIATDSGSLVVDGVSASNNGGGGIVVRGGTATIATSTLDGNLNGGAVATAGSVMLTASTVSNTAPGGDGSTVGPGVLALPGSTMTVVASTIYHNTGQGVSSLGAEVTVQDTTVSATQPSTSAGAAVTPHGNSPAPPDAALAGVTTVSDLVLQRLGRFGRAADHRPEAAASGSLTAVGTLVVGNATPACTGAGGPVTDHGYNVSDDASCAFSATGSLNNGSGKLGTFGAHGGPTNTLVPAKGSDAIDRIPSGAADCTHGATDQRGTSRPQGGACDVGAVEVEQTPLVITPDDLPAGTVGHAYQAQLSATGGLGAPYSFTLSSGQLPDGVTLADNGLISGTPTQSGTFHLTVSVDDPVLKSFVLTIAGASSSASSSASASATSSGASTPASSTPASSSPASSAPASSSRTAGGLADTGARVSELVAVGSAAVAAGVVLLLIAGVSGGRRGRRRAH